MWRDEVRAFSVATRATSWTQLFAGLHQEGHPGLWYALLRIGFGLTHSNLVMPVMALAIAGGAAYLVLRHAPFPFWLRLLTVFGVFLTYEFSVMARSYGLGILMMIIACNQFQFRQNRPLLLGFTLALMANTSVHAAVASLVISLIWALDVLDPERRALLLKVSPAAGIAIAVFGVAIAIMTARPFSSMSFATPLSNLDMTHVLRAVAADPGNGLKGVFVSDIAASGELPWLRFGIDPQIASRLIVDMCLLCVAWGLAKSPKHLAAMLVSVFGFEIVFSGVYPGALRHQGVLTFLLIGICWIAVRDWRAGNSSRFAHRIAIGLLPLMAIQAAALPIVARRHLTHPASSSKALAGIVKSTPRLAGAILMSEPDYLMEALPYYVGNKVYMPRQAAFDYRVYFDKGARRNLEMNLGRLIDIAADVGCTNQAPVLLSIGHPQFPVQASGFARLGPHRGTFAWSAEEKARLSARARLLGQFDAATSDENYQVFEFSPAGCTLPGTAK